MAKPSLLWRWPRRERAFAVRPGLQSFSTCRSLCPCGGRLLTFRRRKCCACRFRRRRKSLKLPPPATSSGIWWPTWGNGQKQCETGRWSRERTICSKSPRMAASWPWISGCLTRCCRMIRKARSMPVSGMYCRSGGTRRKSRGHSLYSVTCLPQRGMVPSTSTTI